MAQRLPKFIDSTDDITPRLFENGDNPSKKGFPLGVDHCVVFVIVHHDLPSAQPSFCGLSVRS